jgi:hypothetical protein
VLAPPPFCSAHARVGVATSGARPYPPSVPQPKARSSPALTGSTAWICSRPRSSRRARPAKSVTEGTTLPTSAHPPGYKSGPATFSSHLIQLAAIAVTRGRESAAEAAVNPPMRRHHVVWMPRRALSIWDLSVVVWRPGVRCVLAGVQIWGGTTFVPWTARCRVKSPVRPCSLDSPQPPLRVAPSRSKLVVAGHVIWAPRLWRHRADCAPQLGRGGGR